MRLSVSYGFYKSYALPMLLHNVLCFDDITALCTSCKLPVCFCYLRFVMHDLTRWDQGGEAVMNTNLGTTSTKQLGLSNHK